MGLYSTLEKRSHPSSPEKWLLRMLGGLETTSGAQVNEETALSWTAFGSGVRFRGEVMGSLPLGVLERLSPRGKEMRPGHYLYPLLHDAPNEEITSFEWRELIDSHVIGWGNHYSQIIKTNRGNVSELWPLNPDRVSPFRGPRGNLLYRVTLPRDSVGGPVESGILRADEVLHIRAFTQHDGIFGRALIAKHREAIGLGLATEEFAARFFGQGASPSGVYEHPGALSETAYNRLKESLEKQHSGLSQAHRLLLLEEGMKWQQVTVDPEKAQFLGLRQFQVVEAARILRIPPHALYSLERATFNNVEQMGIDLVVYSIRPIAVRWEQRMRLALLGPKDRNKYIIEFNLEGLLRGDSAARAAFYQALFNMASISPNEIREKENMNPYDGGDRRFIQLNLIDVDMEPLEPEPLSDEPDDDTMEGRALTSRASPTSRRKLRARSIPMFRRAAASATQQETAAVREAMGRLLGQRDNQDFLDWLDSFYASVYPKILERTMLPAQYSYALNMAKQAAAEVDADYDEAQIQRFVREYHKAFVSRQSQSSVGQLNALIRDTESDDLVLTLDGRLAEWDEKNPEKVGRWDAMRLGGAVAVAVMVGAGVTTFRWNTFGSSCPLCSQLDGKVVGVQQNFVSEGETLDPGGDTQPFTADANIGHEPLHAGCDCMVVAG